MPLPAAGSRLDAKDTKAQKVVLTHRELVGKSSTKAKTGQKGSQKPPGEEAGGAQAHGESGGQRRRGVVA